MSRACLSLWMTALVACGAGSHPPGDDDDIGGGADGDGDGDADADADADTDGDADTGGEGEGELDLGPDARPSDYPEADDWIDTDPSALGPDDPCCDMVGDPVVIDGPDDGGGPPVLAWNGAGWGVAWEKMAFRPLDALGQPIGPVVQLGRGGGYPELEWGVGHYGLAASSQVVMVAADGAVLAGPTMVEGPMREPDITRYTHGRGWVMVHHLDQESGRGDIRASWVTDEAVVDGASRLVGTGFGARVVGLRSRASVAWVQDDGIWLRSFAWPDVEEAARPIHVIETSAHEGRYFEAVAYRDLAVVTAAHGAGVQVVTIDPWLDEIVAGPNAVGRTSIWDRSPAIIAVDERGFLGLCYTTGSGPFGGSGDSEDGVSFVLVGPDATAWGTEIPVVQHLQNAGGCAVGWSGEEFLVAWWEAGLDDNRLVVQRVVPRI